MTSPTGGTPPTDHVQGSLQEALGAAFVIERELGGGGMSRVFVARDVSLDRRVVVKILPESVAEGLSADRFHREIMLSAGLQHPNIVPVIAAGTSGHLPYFIMPLVEGESLRARIASRPLLIPDVVSILRDVARALAYAHGRGIVHRDIKPDNILLSGGVAVVADFGVAKALVDSRPGATQDTARTLTRVGMSLGTPAYMAPEQVVADPAADQRVDIYSVGIMAWEMLAGRPPFSGASIAEVMTAHLTQTPEPLATARPGTPIALAALVSRCLAKDPAERPASGEALLASLDDPALVSGAVPSLASIPAQARPAAGRRLRPLIIAGAVLLLAVAGLWALKGRGEQAAAGPPTIAVLPLELASSDTADAYLAQGVTDEIINALSRVPGVRVASRMAARSMAAATTAPATVAQQLGVTMTLEGSVQRRGDRVRISTQLSNVSDGVAVWSETYDRPATELYALQGAIAASVAAVVRAGVTAGQGPDLESTRNPVAYDHYLRGHYLLQRRGATSLREAITRFESAIAGDSLFARAWAELAQAHAVLPLYTGAAIDRSGRIERAAERALALDSTLAPAHAALGYLHMGVWRWEASRVALARAVQLDSADATAMQWLGENRLLTGDAAGARDAFAAAARLDAGAPLPQALQGVAMSLGGEHDAAVVLLRRVIDADPSQAVPRFMLGTVLCYAGQYVEALSELREASRLAPGVHTVTGTLGFALAKSGDTAGARALVTQLRRAADLPGAQPALAKVYAGLGETGAALAALQRAAELRDPFFSSEPLRSPLFASLVATPSWPALLTTVGFSSQR